jgi:MFS family permease
LTALISLTAEAGAQGETLGVGQSLASLGRILGPLWGGFAYKALGPVGAYALAGGVMAVLAVVALAIRPVAKPQPVAETPAAEA